jgi:hypothetical protein
VVAEIARALHATDYKHANQRTLWRKQDALVIIVDTAGSTTAPACVPRHARRDVRIRIDVPRRRDPAASLTASWLFAWLDVVASPDT